MRISLRRSLALLFLFALVPAHAFAVGSGPLWFRYVSSDSYPVGMPMLRVDTTGPLSITIYTRALHQPGWLDMSLLDLSGNTVFTKHFDYPQGSSTSVVTPFVAAGTYSLKTVTNFYTFYRFETSAAGFVYPSGTDFMGQTGLNVDAAGDYYFYVPPGTRNFAFRLRVPDPGEYGTVTIYAPDGSWRASLPLGGSSSQSRAVNVDPASAGAYWRVHLTDELSDIHFFLYGVPPLLAESPAAWFEPPSPPAVYGVGSNPLWFRNASAEATPVTMPILRVDSAGPVSIKILTQALNGPGWMDLSLLDASGSERFAKHFDFPQGFTASNVAPSLPSGKYFVKTVASAGTFYRFLTSAQGFVWPSGMNFNGQWQLGLEAAGSYFFYVPSGTTAFTIRLRVPNAGEYGTARVIGPDEGTRASLYVSGGTSDSRTVHVDNELAGAFWRVDVSCAGSDIRFFLSGVPSFYAESPNAWFDPEIPAADVGITSTAQFTAPTVTYTLFARNYGPSAATGITVTDKLPAGATLASATASVGSCSGTSTVVCTIPTLATGASATMTLVVNMSVSAALTNTATIAAVETDPNPANNTTSTQFVMIPALSAWAAIALAVSLCVAAVLKL